MFSSKHARPPMRDVTNEKDRGTSMKGDAPARPRRPSLSTVSPTRQRDSKQRPASPTLSKPVTIPSKAPARSGDSRRRSVARDTSKPRRDSAQHDRDALPASVAALLAVTAIPPRKTPKRRAERQRRISIDELVSEWKAEALAMPSYGSHKSMEVLLETVEIPEKDSIDSTDGYPEDAFLASRSTSSDSIPSLEMDERSLLSVGNPPTPGMVRTARQSGISTPRKLRPRSLPDTQDCCLDHPLIPRSVPDLDDDDEDSDNTTPAPFLIPASKTLDRRKSSFKSNLTLSLQTLKTRALSSLSNFSLNAAAAAAGSAPPNDPYAFSDATLWQHPYIFPRFSPEIRPTPFSGTPSESQRRYLNPTPSFAPLSLDEQQSHYRAALHTPLPHPSTSLSQASSSANAAPEPHRSPMIQMTTYRSSPGPNGARRGRSAAKPSSTASSSPDPNSEAGRALAVPPAASGPQQQQQQAVRQREPRENSDFLRVVVLEMNMRRVGKLEETVAGRARIWLPPRQQQQLAVVQSQGGSAVVVGGEQGRQLVEFAVEGGVVRPRRAVPRRWVGVCVDG